MSLNHTVSDIYSDETEHLRQDETRDYQRRTAKALQNAVQSTLGPRGMDKLLAEEGRLVVTDHGSTILSEMKVYNPVGEYLLEVAEQQRESIGDGTTSAVLYATELLTEAIDLIEEDIHPATIIKGALVAEIVGKS